MANLVGIALALGLERGLGWHWWEAFPLTIILTLAVAAYRRALGLGYTEPIPRLFEAAGAKFTFGAV